jgi:hypothetical protein
MKWKQFSTPAKGVDVDQAKAFIKEHKQGNYTLLDVRQPAE